MPKVLIKIFMHLSRKRKTILINNIRLDYCIKLEFLFKLKYLNTPFIIVLFIIIYIISSINSIYIILFHLH